MMSEAVPIVRPEAAGDSPGIDALHEAAFGGRSEADLVADLRAQASPMISLVAGHQSHIVGHILFSPVSVLPPAQISIMGLAPMAVLPSRQRQGIGKALVRAGLESCRDLGVAAVVVLGHPQYYPRFGFRPASTFGLGCEYTVPDEVFLSMELEAGALGGVSGTIRYHGCFPDP